VALEVQGLAFGQQAATLLPALRAPVVSSKSLPAGESFPLDVGRFGFKAGRAFGELGLEVPSKLPAAEGPPGRPSTLQPAAAPPPIAPGPARSPQAHLLRRAVARGCSPTKPIPGSARVSLGMDERSMSSSRVWSKARPIASL